MFAAPASGAHSTSYPIALPTAMAEIYTPSRDNLAQLIATNTELSRQWLRLPQDWERTEESYRSRIWTLTKAFRSDWKARGILYKGSLIETRNGDLLPLLTEFSERLHGFKAKGSWMTKDNRSVSLTNADFLALGDAIAHYAEKCFEVSFRFRQELNAMSFDYLRLIPVHDFDAMSEWIRDSINWPSNVYNEAPRQMNLAASFLAPYIQRIETLESQIGVLEGEIESLQDPPPFALPSGMEVKITASKRSPYYWVYLRVYNHTEADRSISGWSFVLKCDRPPISASGGVVLRRTDGCWDAISSSALVREGKSIRVSLKFEKTDPVNYEFKGYCRR